MIRLIFAFCLLFLPHINALANTTAAQCSAYNNQEEKCNQQPGCEFTSSTGECSQCPTGTYSNANEASCTACPSTHPSSAEGANKNQCYKTCQDMPISNGTKKASNAYYDKACEYTIICNSGYTQFKDTCVLSEIDCKSLDGCDGDITGDATLVDTTGEYNYGNCKCTKTTTKNGTIRTDCTYDGQQWQCTKTAISCDGGYCGEEECNIVHAGYYSPDKDPKCYPCPMGSTSNSQKAAQTDCYINGGNNAGNTNAYTKFCDATGTNCFTLVDDYYYVKP